MLELYENIRRRRLELGMSQEELAKRMGYTDRSTIAKIEAGRTDLPVSKIEAFAQALGTTGMHLMGWETDERIDNLDKRMEQLEILLGDKANSKGGEVV